MTDAPPRRLLNKFVRDTLAPRLATTQLTAQRRPLRNDIAHGGLTGDATYFIRAGAAGPLMAVVKAKRLSQEMVGHFRFFMPACRLLGMLPLSLCRLVLPMEVWLADDADVHWCFMALPPADGVPLTAMMAAVSRHHEAEKRRQAMAALTEGVVHSAMGLAELNTLSLTAARDPGPHQMEHDDFAVNYFMTLLERQPDLFPFSRAFFGERYAAAFQAAHSTLLWTGYCHGDANLTNMFYDAAAGKAFLIDNLTLFHSIDNGSGKPLGNVCQEYCYARCSLRLFAHHYRLADGEAALLDQAFSSGYRLLKSDLLFTPSQLRLNEMLYWISYAKVIDALLYNNRTGPRRRLQSDLAFCLDSLHSLLRQGDATPGPRIPTTVS